MRMVVVAASGRVGQQVLRQAVESGHDVTAAARAPDRVTLDGDARVVRLDLASATTTDVASVVTGADAVISCLGARHRADVGIAARGTERLVDGMEAAGVARLIVISAAPVASLRAGDGIDSGDDLLTRVLLAPVLRLVFRRSYDDLATMEALLDHRASGWTVVRPPRLTDAPLTGRYRTGLDRNLPGARSISRADLAHLLVRLPQMTETVDRFVAVGY